MEFTDSLKVLFIETAQALKGSARRVFMARTVQELGSGGQRRAECALGWSRATIRKGARELASGFAIVDAFALRGRKRAEDHLPNLLADLTAIVDGQSQIDPQCRTNRLYTRLTAAEVRHQLITQKGYTNDELPTVQTIGGKLNALGYHPAKVAKTQPQKRSPRPTLSSSRYGGSIVRPMPRTRCCGSRWMRKRRSRSARSPGAARAGCRSRRRTTTSGPTLQSLRWGFSYPPPTSCSCTG